MEKLPLQSQESGKHSFDDHHDLTTTTGPPKSPNDHWEVGENWTHSEHVQTGQLEKTSAVLPKIPTNDEKRASKTVDAADAECHKVKVRRRRKLLKPCKVSVEKIQAEGDPKISRGALVSTLKPRSAQPWCTVPCRQIREKKRSAVRLRQIPSEAGRGETCGHVETKKAAPSEWTPPDEGTPIFTQPENPSVNAVISEEKWRSLSQPKNDKGNKISLVLPTPARLLASPKPTPGTSSTGQPGEATEEPLLIHGLTVEEYQSVYHSVVDPLLLTASGNPRRHSLELGRTIKQRLWERLFCPQLHEEVQADGRAKITETFCHPALCQHAPLLELDVSDEPAPQHAAERRQLKPGSHNMETTALNSDGL